MCVCVCVCACVHTQTPVVSYGAFFLFFVSQTLHKHNETKKKTWDSFGGKEVGATVGVKEVGATVGVIVLSLC
jgi:hypothetical protein